MTTDEEIRDKKLQFNIKRAATNISTLPAGKIDKYVDLTGE